ncbi:Fc.00g015530.m01.CDS01 [Cosmosporella sp. VM-42]
MADAVLTSLCAICHISSPKYKCPRCNLQTCSLPCIKKHKAWSDCTGERDATAYVKPSKLRTPAGIDHDYNFLHKIEMSVERTEKLLVEEKAIVQQEELRPLTVQEVKWKTGRDGRKRKVLVTRILKEAKGRVFERMLGVRLKALNVGVLCAPMGMRRQRENNTTLNRRTGRINWQVEWMTFQEEGTEEEEKTSRALSKVMDDAPLYEAYHTMLEEQQRLKGQPRKKSPRNQEEQSSSDSTWAGSSYPLQDPETGKWAFYQGADPGMWPSERDEVQKRRFQYFLARPRQRSDRPLGVTQLVSTDCFREILTNTRVLEFPTVYVLNADETLPGGFVLAPKDAVPSQGTKRKNAPSKKAPGKAAKRRKQNGRDLEEGEVKSDDEHIDDDGNRGAVMLEAGEVIAEQSLGEEDDEDDDTSSSGSDSEDN